MIGRRRIVPLFFLWDLTEQMDGPLWSIRIHIRSEVDFP